MMPLNPYNAYALLFSYPGRDMMGLVASISAGNLTSFGNEPMSGAAGLTGFAREAGRMSLEEMEELYTRTFDINPVMSLETGWHLYGEQYERGAFMVKMRGLLRSHGIEESGELPDHLTHVLRLLGRMTPADAGEFAGTYLTPCLNKMSDAFSDPGNPYKILFDSLVSFIGRRTGEGAAVND